MHTLPSRKLPGTAIALSELTVGTWGLCAESYGRVFPEQRNHALSRALSLGVRSFDMAPCWGDDGLAERAVASAVGSQRDEVTYITRAGKLRGEHGLASAFSAAELRAACEGSLRRLGTDRIDVWLLHNPSEAELRSEELRSAAEALISEGKVRAWGASVCHEEDARAALEVGAQVLCIPFSLLSPRGFWDVEAACRARGVGVLARSVLMYGMLAGRFGPKKRFGPDDHRARRWSPEALAARVHQTNELRDYLHNGPALNVGALALRFVLAHDAVCSAIVGPRTAGQLEGLITHIEGEPPALPPEQLELLRTKLRSV
jgi:aryl-alcohol dehydrogenase-like predicted oxidoreductase